MQVRMCRYGLLVMTTIVLLIVASCSSDVQNPASSSAKVADRQQEPTGKAAAGDHAAQTAPEAGGKKHHNRLARETSPYLLMHANNPVDWYPWGEEALAKAKTENKPIFLSIGYSSCYWCHVMERESFLDEEIAAFLNKHFVCIKVDREERPDIDAIYMAAVQIITRGGGWPMSVFLTPEGKPFFGGTYFPARDGDRAGSPGFWTVINTVQTMWNQKPEAIHQNAVQLAEMIKTHLRGRPALKPVPIQEELLAKVQQELADQYDPRYGGFGYSPANPRQPKFPEPSNLLFLLDRAEKKNDDEARQLLVGTLERMAMGGIRDHLGGGFHRYSVDRFWRIPHFEKMLYDNGQLATVYAEAYRLTGREDFRQVVDELLQFVLRELTAEGGAFYTALDAESEHVEGKFYRWKKEDLAKLLSKDEMSLFASVYALDGEPNFEEHFYVPQWEKPIREIAAEKKTTPEELEARLAPIRVKLLAARNKRQRPLTDTKILTSWNGLMIRGLADAGRLLKNERYVQAAQRAADFLLDKLRAEDGRLLRTYSQSQAKLNAYLDDYAFLVDGLIALYRATGEQKWIHAAEELTAKQIELFWDERDGGFFFTSQDHEALIARGKDPIDGAQPSGNSVSAGNLVYLAEQLRRPEYFERAEKTINAAASLLELSPNAVPRMALAVSALLEAREKQKNTAR